MVNMEPLCFSQWSDKLNPVSITTSSPLCIRQALQNQVVKREERTGGLGGESETLWRESSPATAGPFFSLSSSSDAHSWSFRLSQGGGGRERPTDTRESSLLCYWQREEGGRVKDVCNIIMSFSAWKVQVTLIWGSNFTAMPLQSYIFMINPTTTFTSKLSLQGLKNMLLWYEYNKILTLITACYVLTTDGVLGMCYWQ